MDIWDWLKGLRRWWWMIVVFPIVAGTIGWMTAPEPEYETRWTVNIHFGDPTVSNNPGYIDFVLLDDFHLLMNTGVLGDVMYLRLPEDVQASLSRDEFGGMVDSSRKARFVEIVISGDDPEIVQVVAETIDANVEELTNHYLIPPTYHGGAATVDVLDPMTEPALNPGPRTVQAGAIMAGAALAAVAATGVAEWLRISYRAKYASK